MVAEFAQVALMVGRHIEILGITIQDNRDLLTGNLSVGIKAFAITVNNSVSVCPCNSLAVPLVIGNVLEIVSMVMLGFALKTIEHSYQHCAGHGAVGSKYTIGYTVEESASGDEVNGILTPMLIGISEDLLVVNQLKGCAAFENCAYSVGIGNRLLDRGFGASFIYNNEYLAAAFCGQGNNYAAFDLIQVLAINRNRNGDYAGCCLFGGNTQGSAALIGDVLKCLNRQLDIGNISLDGDSKVALCNISSRALGKLDSYGVCIAIDFGSNGDSGNGFVLLCRAERAIDIAGNNIYVSLTAGYIYSGVMLGLASVLSPLPELLPPWAALTTQTFSPVCFTHSYAKPLSGPSLPLPASFRL